MSKKLKSIELFAGIGGFRLATDENNIENIWANDIDDNAVKVYKSNFGEQSIVQGDINLLLETVPNHDLLTGGFPCQPFSKAGKKKGIDDYRGTLFEAIVKILIAKSPRFFVLENVNSLLFMQDGRHFRTILSALASLEYKIEWRVLNAESFGLPQHRERVIILGSKDRKSSDSYFLDQSDIEHFSDAVLDIIASYKNWKNIEETTGKFKVWGMAYKNKCVTFDVAEKMYAKPKKLYEILQPNKDVPREYFFTEDTLKRIENSTYVNRFYNGVQILYNQAGGARMGYSIFGIEGVSPTLTASTSRHYERYKIGNEFRRLTNIEYARLQGFPDHHCDAVIPYNQYKLYGNAVPHQIVSYAIKKLINNEYTVIEKRSLSLFDFDDEEKL